MTTPKQTTATVISSHILTNNYLNLKLEPAESLEYKAGQYISLKINDEGERRSYSMASWPSQPKLEIAVDVSPMGKGSQYILALKPGQEVEILYPMGRFTVEDNLEQLTDQPLLFIGTGSGIVPLRSMIHSLLEDKNYKSPVRLHWGMRHEEDLFWVEEFEQLHQQFNNFKLDIVLSQAGEHWKGCRGHVNDCLVEHQPSWSGWSAFLCGNQGMIEQVSQLLQDRGLASGKIYHEQFY